MSKLSLRLYVVGFLMMLIMPLVIYPFVWGELDHNNYENRELTGWETVKNSDLFQLPMNLENFLIDNMPYKNEMVLLNKKIDLTIFHDLYDEKVMVGKNDWLFYKADNCIMDYRGAGIISEEKLQNYVSIVQRLESQYAQQGRELYIMITPNKEEIYGDLYLPDRIQVKNEMSRADKIVQYLRDNTDVRVIYPKDTLLEARNRGYTVWCKYDTHWNALGAFIGSHELMGEDSLKIIGEICIQEEGTRGGDLANMIGMGNIYCDDINYVICDYKPDVEVDEVDNIPQPNLNYRKTRSDAINQKSIMIIGDSFTNAMEPFISANYSKAVYVHRSNYRNFEEDLIMREEPDIIVFQCAERFVEYFDGVMEGFIELE